MKRKKGVLYVLLFFILAWFLYFDIVAYVHFERTRTEYEETLQKYNDATKKLKEVRRELKELRLQIENSGNNLTQTKPSTSSESSAIGK